MRKLMKSGFTAGVALLLFGFFIGCNELSENDLNDSLEKSGTGRVIIKLTDAPFPADLVEEANVSIDGVQLLKYEDDDPEENDDDEGDNDDEPGNGNGDDNGDDNGNGNGNGDDNGEGDDNGNGTEGNDSFVMLDLEDTLTVNLLDLRNGVTEVLAEADVPAGTYRQIRLHVVGASIVLDDSLLGASDQSTFDLKVPSGDASGLKIHLNPPLEVVDGANAEILIDFDVSRSFIMQGNLNHGQGKVQGFIFKPVVRAVAHVQTETGKISGTVTDEEGDEIENALLTLIEGADNTITSARTDDDGFYRMTGILPGDYLLVCSKEDEDATADITVEAGKETGQDFELSSSSTGEVVVDDVNDNGDGDDDGNGDDGNGDNDDGDENDDGEDEE